LELTLSKWESQTFVFRKGKVEVEHRMMKEQSGRKSGPE